MPQIRTPRRASKTHEKLTSPSAPKSVDVGETLGLYDTNTVRDRVRQWQAQGGGVVTAPDVYTENEESPDKDTTSFHSKSPTKKSPRTPIAARKTATDANGSDTPKSRDGRQKRRSNDLEKQRHRSTSAPAKRVVSDAHWRKDRGPPKHDASSKVPKEDQARERVYADDDGIRVRPISTSERDCIAGNERRRKGSSKHTGTVRAGTTSGGSSRHAGKHRAPSSARSISAGEEDKPASPDAPSRSANDHMKRRTPAAEGESAILESPSNKTRLSKDSSTPPSNALSGLEPCPTYGSIPEQKESKKPPKSHILRQVFGDSGNVFAKPQTTPVETPRVPAVEAWLNNTPDPFIDAEPTVVEDILPESIKTGRTSSTPELVQVDDPNKIWDTLESKERARSGVRASRRRKRIPSSSIYEDNPFPSDFSSGSPLHASSVGSTSASKLVDLVDNASESPSTLTRRGARKSVSSPKREAKPIDQVNPCNDDKTWTITSNADTSFVEPPDARSPLQPPGRRHRPFPTTGKHRLSTIASVDTFRSNVQTSGGPSIAEAPDSHVLSRDISTETLEAESRDHFDPHSLTRSQSRLTKHADLMSVLSMPEPGTKSIRSARSIRTNRSRLATATIGDLMKELADDETKYMRELRTLVDGVIPVLLTCVLSKSDSAVAAGLFQQNYTGQADPNFTKPIVDMGIALERLKTLHRRIPMQDAKTLLTWAQGAQRVYAEYLKAWRMGFQDVVVNLAPAADSQTPLNPGSPSRSAGLEDGLPINKDGDVVNGDGERVDVAFLLKRPLVRLKYLAKTLKGINVVSPSAEAEALATKYQNLVTVARNRSDEERARLEDEAAANIDATRARDPRTLAPLTSVSIDRTRRVRARDHFNLALQHSSGQRVDCRVELLLRDEASEVAGSGDLLVCEVDATGRWLLFPPISFSRVSARTGDLANEIIVMIRGLNGAGAEWHEILSLTSEDEQAGFEWVQMLGLTPVPPTFQRTQSFLSKHQPKRSSPTAVSTLDAPMTTIPVTKSRTPSPRAVEVPIGEQAANTSKTWNGVKSPATPNGPLDTDYVKTKHKGMMGSQHSTSEDVARSPHNYVDDVNDMRSLPSQASQNIKREQEPMARPRSFKEALGLTGTSTNSLGLKRARAQKLIGYDGSPRSLKSPPASRYERSPRPSLKPLLEARGPSESSQDHVSSVSLHQTLTTETPRIPRDRVDEQKSGDRPDHHRSVASTPSMDLPIIPKIRRDSPPTTPIDETEEEPEWLSPPASKLPPSSTRGAKGSSRSSSKDAGISAPSPPSHSSSSSLDLKASSVPVLTASTARAARRRSSSPLKHEYEPSTASDSSESDASTVNRNEVSSVSSSDDDELEEGDAPTPLLPLGALGRVPKRSPQPSIYSLPNGTLKPSESASQAPYKKVPSQPTKASKTIASIFSWSDKGSWDSLHPDECSIVITPGLIEAFEMSAAHSAGTPPSSSTPVVDVDAFSDMASNIIGPEDIVKNDRPLVALELTPLVPLRRGTAIDISIRSPPTSSSQITSGNNIMFRSRNPEECEALYALINHSRIHNPTYIALQNARGPFGTGTDLDRRASIRAGGSRMGSWFGGLGGSPGYRASSAPTPSIAPSESSIGSMSSAFSALKRFRIGGGGMFNIARSTISSRDGSRANSLYTSSDNSSGSGASSPLPPGVLGDPHSNIGLGNTKIRLYLRESNTRWRDMGSARLTIMRPSPADLSSGTSASGESLARPSSAHQGANEKRIVVRGKTKGEVLLDATLGETCFERVGRQGIAVSVWEDIVGPNGEVGTVGAVGGVGASRAKVYMIQMKGEAETTYTFSIVGRLRY
ncbi:MAG: hypothetical protein L6R38_003434 [Xanthoria sp. 2 TBL-2021]|nr:MAG: hypothetical protein L6R38_003434 [Xanthoria sp. 2 TBL-2021]